MKHPYHIDHCDTLARADNLVEMGSRNLADGRPAQALALFEQAMSCQPTSAIPFFNAGVACHQLKALNKAIGYYRQALDRSPDLTVALYNMGIAHVQADAPQEAIPFFIKAVENNPNYIEALYNLGVAHEKLGNIEQALSAFSRALDIDPDHDKALNNIGLIKQNADELDEAIDHFKRAIAVNPKLADAHYNLGIALQSLGEYENGRICYRNALEVNNEYTPARWLYRLSLPRIYTSTEQIDAMRTRFADQLEALIASSPLDTEEQRRLALKGVGTTTNFFLQYQGLDDLKLQKRYGKFICDVMASNFPQWSMPRQRPRIRTNKKIRIGYVTSFMYGHTVGDFLLGWLKNYSRDDFEIRCYHIGFQSDSVTQAISVSVDHFRHIPAVNIEAAARQIAADDLDIVVYPEIGMCPKTIQLAAMYLAPVQCAGFWQPVTTGLPTIDYFLTGNLFEPEDAERYYSESLIRLPNLGLCYTPPAMPEKPKSRSDFGIPSDRFVFLSSQTLYKYLPQDDDLYPRIASNVPEALFVFISDKYGGITEMLKDRLHRSFKRYGLNSENYCLFVPRLIHADFLSLHMAADVLLDTMEWSGGHTTLEALSCGLPVVTLPGRFLRGRTSYGMLKMMGVAETISTDKDDYCRIAVRLAQDPTFYEKVKSAIIKNAPLVFNDKAFINGLEDFYRTCTSNDDLRETITPHPEKDRTASTNSPEDVEALKVHWEAAIYSQKAGDIRSAIESFQRVLRINPNHIQAAFGLGNLFLRQSKADQALKWFKHALALAPEWGVLLNNIGKTHQLKGEDEPALTHFKKAVQLSPDLAEAWFNLAEMDMRANQLTSAVENYQKAITIDPNMSAAYNNMGNALKDLYRYQEAIAAFKKVLDLDPDLPQGHYNLGGVYRLVEDFPSAVQHLSNAIKLSPGHADAWNNLALTCKNMGDFDRALLYFNRALQITPGLAIARWNRSFVHFLKYDWHQGWKDFEVRFDLPQRRSIYPHRIKGQRWDGEPIRQQTLLVHDEQGLGDTFQFIKWLPWAKARCKRLVFETRPEIIPLIENSLGIDEIVERSTEKPPEVPFDQYIPLMSIPGLIDLSPDRMTDWTPYIKAPEAKIYQWRSRLPRGRIKVGIVWAGRPEHGNDANRSCCVETIAQLFQNQSIQFIGLQKGAAEHQLDELSFSNAINMGSQLNSFSDTAAILTQLDLLITVDTSVAHLAGAMGRPVWVMIPYIPDWRWGTHGSHTPWYPTMKLFRQPRPKEWQPVIEIISRELDDLAEEKP